MNLRGGADEFRCDAVVPSKTYCNASDLASSTPTGAALALQVNPKGMLPPPRHSHCLYVHNDWLYLFGGVNELGAASVSLSKAFISRTAMDRAGALHASSGGASALHMSSSGAAALHMSSSGGAGGLGSGTAAAGGAMELEWVELDSELPYNKNRAGVMQQGQLRCYQLGSAALGRSVNEDDAEKGR